MPFESFVFALFGLSCVCVPVVLVGLLVFLILRRGESVGLKESNERLARLVERVERRVRELEHQLEQSQPQQSTPQSALVVPVPPAPAAPVESVVEAIVSPPPFDESPRLEEYLSSEELERWEALNESLRRDEERKRAQREVPLKNTVSAAELDALLAGVPGEPEPTEVPPATVAPNTVSLDDLLAVTKRKAAVSQTPEEIFGQHEQSEIPYAGKAPLPLRPARRERPAEHSAPTQEPGPAVPIGRPATPTPMASQRPEAPRREKTSHPKANIDWEQLIGKKILGWVAVVGFLIGIAWVFEYARRTIEIPKEVYVAGMVAVGLALLGGGFWFFRKGWLRFASMLNSAGVVSLFMTAYATYAYFRLIPEQTTSGLLAVVVIGSFLLTGFYRSILLALFSILGGLAVPLMIRTDADPYSTLFPYLLLLNLGTLIVVNRMRRPPIALVAMLGTQFEILLWYGSCFEGATWRERLLEAVPISFETAPQLVPLLGFQAVFYIMYLADMALTALNARHKTHVEETVRALIAPMIAFGWSYHLLHEHPKYGGMFGVAALAACGWYAMFYWIVKTYKLTGLKIETCASHERNTSRNTAITAVLLVLATAFLAVAIPLQLGREWIGLGWVTVGALLWMFGNRLNEKTLRGMSHLFASLAGVRILTVDLPEMIRAERAMPPASGLLICWNEINWPVLLFALVMLAAAWTTRPPRGGDAEPEHRLRNEKDAENRRNINRAYGIVGFVLLFFTVSWESYHYFTLRGDLFAHADFLAQLSLTCLGTLFAAVLLALGAFRNRSILRGGAVMLFVVTAIKLVLGDSLQRPAYELAVLNPCGLAFLAIAAVYILADLFASPFVARTIEGTGEPHPESISLRTVGMLGVGIAFLSLSLECFRYYQTQGEAFGIDADRLAVGSLSVLWALFAAVLLAVGIVRDRTALRCAALVLLAVLGAKMLVFELFQYPQPMKGYPPLMDPYAIPAFAAIFVLLGFGIVASRTGLIKTEPEKQAMQGLGLVGIAFLLMTLSVECYYNVQSTYQGWETAFQEGIVCPAGEILGWFSLRQLLFYPPQRAAIASLSPLWTSIALVLLVIGFVRKSPLVRYAAFGVMGLLAAKIVFLELFQFPLRYAWYPLLNMYSLPIACVIALFILTAILGTRSATINEQKERDGFLAIGFVGLALLFTMLSVECFRFFAPGGPANFGEVAGSGGEGQWLFLYAGAGADSPRIATASLSILWTFFAGLLLGVGLICRSKPIRIAAIIAMGLLGAKLLCFELFLFPPYFERYVPMPLLNMYGISSLAVVLLYVATVYAVLGTVWGRNRVESVEERLTYTAFGYAGAAFLFVLLSVECFHYFELRHLAYGVESVRLATGSLTALWALFAAISFAVGWHRDLRPVRYVALGLLGVVILKVLCIELFRFPDMGDYYPILNPYGIPTLLVILICFGVCISGATSRRISAGPTGEREACAMFGYVGAFFLFTMMSMESWHVFHAPNLPDEAWKAQAALSILWICFGGGMMLVGFVWRLVALRWTAIVLWGVTILKVFAIDLSGTEPLYKGIVFIILAIIFGIAAWAYQRRGERGEGQNG